MNVPDGFRYWDAFVTAGEEERLLEAISRIEFATFEMRGVIARRRVAFFGRSYDTADAVRPPIPEFLLFVRDRLSDWAGVDRDAFVMALINDYSPGAPIGWHRDAPQYGIVGGVSLLSACRMKFRPYVRPATGGQRRTATHEMRLEQRSAYLMTGAARNAYEHHIPAVASHRYSITFRTARTSR
jgi:alkylated DNA repair dioxygenase AlkB